MLSAGPISLEILAPLQSSRLVIDDKDKDKDSGIKAKLVFAAGYPASVEEPRFTRRIDSRNNIASHR